MKCFATCQFGVEALVREELKILGMENVRAEDARVFFEADWTGVVDANLWLRCADRVFIQWSSLPATSFDELYEGIRALPWHRLLPKEAQFVVTGKTALSKLVSVRDVQAIAKKAIADTMMAHFGYPRCPETGETYTLEIGMLRDMATVALNTSGAGLNRRGYRDLSVKAPLRETLAAAMVTLSRYRGAETLLDPCCGSGTIAIEGAMIASRTAPGLLRTFAFDGWQAQQALAEQRREHARAQRIEGGFPHVLASDIDDKAVSIAHRHAKRAGVNGLIDFTTKDVQRLTLERQRAVVVCNPPYGQRLDLEEGRTVARALGKLKTGRPEMGLYILSADEGFEAAFGQKADRKRKMYNGAVKCELYQYFRKGKPKSAVQTSENAGEAQTPATE